MCRLPPGRGQPFRGRPKTPKKGLIFSKITIPPLFAGTVLGAQDVPRRGVPRRSAGVPKVSADRGTTRSEERSPGCRTRISLVRAYPLAAEAGPVAVDAIAHP